MPAAAQLREAASRLLATPRRSLLTLTGIAIGAGALIALVTVGAIARSEAIEQFRALGTDILSVHAFLLESNAAGARKTGLAESDAADLARLPSIDDAAPYAISTAELRLGAHGTRRVSVVGATRAFARIHNLELEDGRFLSPLDGYRPFAVIGADVANALRDEGAAPAPGATFRTHDAVYTIIGVLEPEPRGRGAIRPDEMVFVTIGHATRRATTRDLTGITLRMAPDVHYLTASAAVTDHFRLLEPRLNVRVDSPIQIIEQMEAQMRLFALLLGTVGGISLVLGGVGLMNAMLGAVREQRAEIGIRRAFGARQGDIRRQYLTQSGMLCLLGGLLGAVLGVGTTLIISHFAGWTWQLSGAAIALGLGTAGAVGMGFGFYPARHAARLDPIEALRDGR
ncbi:MAG: ABC transporter permease [Acidobacteria bacterium]|nr:ABC transporter permease [Acidobacteriota bacterium]